MTYELMLVATSDKGDSLLTRVEKVNKATEARDLKVDRLGRKTLAYPINKKTDASYFVLNFEAEGASIKPVVDKLKLEQEDLLRYLIVKKQPKKVSKAKVKRAKASEEEEKAKPKVTVAVKSASTVKSTKTSKGGKSTSKKPTSGSKSN